MQALAPIIFQCYKENMKTPIAEAVREWLKNETRSYTELARITKVSRRTLLYIASGAGMTLETFEKLSKHVQQK
jgi:predicted transcriptional regulator